MIDCRHLFESKISSTTTHFCTCAKNVPVRHLFRLVQYNAFVFWLTTFLLLFALCFLLFSLSVDALWSSMSSCAALHPDADEGDDDGEGDFLFDATEIENGLRRTGLGEGDDEEDYYQGGENVDAYAHMNSNDARLRALEQRMGVSAAEMYGDDEEEEEEDEEEETVDSRIPFNPLKSKSPDEPAVVASQLSKANEQVQAATAASTTTAPRKREREDGQGDEPADNAGPQIR